MKRRSFLRDGDGSLTVEAMLILPIILLLIVLFIRFSLMLQQDLTEAAEKNTASVSDETGIGFLRGGPPARRIRDADLLIDLGYSLKERLPQWFRP